MSDTPVPGGYVNPSGKFTRDQRNIPTRVAADGRDGLQGSPVGTGSWSAGPFIVRRLLGLQDVARPGAPWRRQVTP